MRELNSASDGSDSWRGAVIPLNSTLKHAIAALNQVGFKLLMVIDEYGMLKGTVSDGDIRRGLLKGFGLSSFVTEVLHHDALVVPPGVSREVIMKLMIVNKIQQIPIVDDGLRILGLHVWDEIAAPPLRSNKMIIMAGGRGTRLRPFTENCPKPLVNVAGKPMLEHIIERAKVEGFSDFIISIQYLGRMIEEYFGDGSRFGVAINYLREEEPLGTAGALSLLSPFPSESFVVTNGDVLTDIRYGDLLDFHLRYEANATMAVLTHEWQHPYGVVQTSGVEIIGFDEKPVARTHINAGVYALSPSALEELKHAEYCDMPTLFQNLRERSRLTVAYPMHEPWLDVGRPDDLERASNTISVAGGGGQ